MSAASGHSQTDAGGRKRELGRERAQHMSDDAYARAQTVGAEQVRTGDGDLRSPRVGGRSVAGEVRGDLSECEGRWRGGQCGLLWSGCWVLAARHHVNAAELREGERVWRIGDRIGSQLTEGGAQTQRERGRRGVVV